MNIDNPLVSIVTVSYNAVSTIEQTILSVINQTYSNIEYIIIDGGSTDGTIEIIRKYENKIAYWVSEPDGGIYDAMNKGVRKTTGQWLNFMNAGDSFYNKEVLFNLFENFNGKQVDVLYGDTMIKCLNKSCIKKAFPLETMCKSLPFCHQSVFVKTDVMKKYLFDVRFRIAADYNFFYTIYNRNYIFHYMEAIISIYDASDGISSKQREKAYKEICLINGKLNGFFNKIRYALVVFLLKYKIVQ